MKRLLLSLIIFSCVNICFAQQTTNIISSPDKNIVVSCDVKSTTYSIAYKKETVLKDSKLGVVREDEDFSKDLQLVKSFNSCCYKR